MTPAKIYVVFEKNTGKTTFFNNWEKCKTAVKHRSDVLYKSFKTESLAKEYAEELQIRFVTNQNQEKTDFAIYTDGSYQPKCAYASWAYVVINQQNEKVTELAGMCQEKATSRNIDGEVFAALQAGEWAFTRQCKVTLFYDYQGIESWALGDWKSQTPIAIFYTKRVKQYLPFLSFSKVKAHTGDQWNEYVDQLAKQAIKNYLSHRHLNDIK